MERKENKGFLSKLTCGPSEAEVSFMNHTRKQGLLLCSILDFLELNIPGASKQEQDGASKMEGREAGGGEGEKKNQDKAQDKTQMSLLDNMFSSFKFSSDRKQDTQSNNPRQGGREVGGGGGGEGEQESASVKPLCQGGQTEGSNSKGLKEEAKGDGEEQGREDRHEGNVGWEGEELEEGRPAFGIGLVLESWKPSNLSRALNLIGNTREAVKVHSVAPLPLF